MMGVEEVMEKSEIRKNGEGFIDRSKVRILLCDNDERSLEEVFVLLCGCSYQVTSVKSPRQVIDALNAEGPDIDIILSEVDLPMSKGLKMLKYIMRDKELRRIPVIMMSAKDEVPLVVKCLKFGAVDYLVKPLRTNELLNLWTHMWRRRRMLGLVEKNIVNYELDLVVSDHNDANTNSTTLFSDDMDDKSGKTCNPEIFVSNHQEEEQTNTTTAAAIATAVGAPLECLPDVPGISDRRTGQMSYFPKKSELKIGESSAFFTYVKSSMPNSINQGSPFVHETTPQHVSIVENPIPSGPLVSNVEGRASTETPENHLVPDDHLRTNSIVPNSFSMERSYTPTSLEISQQRNSNEEISQDNIHSRNDSSNNLSGSYTRRAYPYYMPGIMNQVTMSSSATMYHKNLHGIQNPVLSQYNHMPQIPGMASYPYYPFGICLQPGQMPAPHPWPSLINCFSSNEGKPSKVDRREAALMKFRQKRKERCFDKKIRYVNRKKLAECRPRLRGQFVRKVNGINVDLNWQPASVEDDEEEEEEEYDEEDQTANMDFSPDE